MKSAGNVFEVDKGGTLTLTDCKGSSSISHSDVEWEETCWFLTALLICMVVRFVIINVQASIKQTAQAWRLIKAL